MKVVLGEGGNNQPRKPNEGAVMKLYMHPV
jgi:hypothetical protein